VNQGTLPSRYSFVERWKTWVGSFGDWAFHSQRRGYPRGNDSITLPSGEEGMLWGPTRASYGLPG
jgi:hypothetical protein